MNYNGEKYPLVNHFKSDYIVFSGIDKFLERFWFFSEPKDYLKQGAYYTFNEPIFKVL